MTWINIWPGKPSVSRSFFPHPRLMAYLSSYGWPIVLLIFLESLNYLFYVGLTMAIAINAAHFLEEFRNQIFHFIQPIIALLVLSFAKRGSYATYRFITSEAAWAWFFQIFVVMAFDSFAMWDNGRRLADLKTIHVVSNQQAYWISCLVRLGLCLVCDVIAFFTALLYFKRVPRETYTGMGSAKKPINH